MGDLYGYLNVIILLFPMTSCTLKFIHIFQRYFDENPRDFQTLRHDKALHTVKLQDHLTDVPEYIVPSSLKNIVTIVNDSKKKPEKVKFKTGRNKAFNKYLVKLARVDVFM